MIKTKGFTLMDIIVGTALVLIVFLGIFGAYQLGLKVIGLSRNKITATSIANQQLELVRNLPYESIGIEGGFPDGVLAATSSTWLNNVQYSIERRVDYVVDSADGVSSPADDCPNDYKKVEIKVSWQGQFPGEISLGTDIAPKNLTQECAISGGILSVSVFDAQGQMLSSPLIEVKDPATDEVLKTATPSDGHHYFALATSTYKVVVSKSGYSTSRTYGTDEVATPEKPHLIILAGETTEVSFSIDKVSTFSVDTLSPWGRDYFSDSFADDSKISKISNLVVAEGEVKLATSTDGYLSSGYLFSQGIQPPNLVNWDELSFSDSEPPLVTDLRYQIYFASGTDWLIIPDEDLSGNSQGFDAAPVDLSNLDAATYSGLKIKGNFSSSSTSSTPVLYGWELSWITSEATPISYITFNLRGEKIIGTDENEDKVYKYSQDHISDSAGHIDIPNLEWDAYTFSIDPNSGLDLVEIDPSPQPISLSPDTWQPVDLYLEAQNSLLLTVQDLETLEPIFSASTTLDGFSQFTDEKGQTYFIPLDEATYDLNVTASGYLATSTSVWVSGDVTETVKLRRIE
jgi:hypothetical protein